MRDLQHLKRISILTPLTLAQLRRIVSELPAVSYPENKIILRQADRSSKIYIILKGAVKLHQEEAGGEKIYLGELKQGQVFGVDALFNPRVCRAMVTTSRPSQFLLLDRKLLRKIIGLLEPDQALRFLAAFGRQIQDSCELENRRYLHHQTQSLKIEVEKQRALTQMVAAVAHEINTPLGIINTAVGIMARELAEPEEITTQRAADIAESLELIRRNVERARDLIQDFKKVSVSQITYRRELLDISEMIREAINLIRVSLKGSRISVQFVDHLQGSQRNWIGYRSYLSQILINLLTNVERYAYPNEVGGVVEIEIGMNKADQYQLSVRDQGRGIAPENLERIFEPFYTTGHGLGGTGLGLSIVHNLVTNALKGQIEVKSRPGEGTQFTISFPRSAPAVDFGD
jgi:signal transduction histidine kinase